MNDREAFIRAINERPDDDLTRLVFADWLDEHGEEVLASFIRTQCEFAGLTPCEHRNVIVYDCAYCFLRREQVRLFAQLGATWDPGIHVVAYHAWPAHLSHSPVVAYRRGFPEVYCRQSWWIGRACPAPACRNGQVPVGTRSRKCRVCHGTARIEVNGPKVARSQPVLTLGITDDLVAGSEIIPRFVTERMGHLWTDRHLVKWAERGFRRDQNDPLAQQCRNAALLEWARHAAETT